MPEENNKRKWSDDDEKTTKKHQAGADHHALIKSCVAGVGGVGEVDKVVLQVAAKMRDTYLEVMAYMGKNLGQGKIKLAMKLLEQLWIEVMQSDAAGTLRNPFNEFLVYENLDAFGEKWCGMSSGSSWEGVLGIYSRAAKEVAGCGGYEGGSEFEVRESVRGGAILRDSKLSWPEVQDTTNPKLKAARAGEFCGKILHCEGLIVKPLSTKRLENLAEEIPLQLAVHSLVYGSMFVTGQAMGLSQAFHDATLQEPWAHPPTSCLSVELYSHLVNRRSSPHPFLSMIPIADGSLGRVQDFDFTRFTSLLTPTLPGLLFCNPPYVEELLNRDLPKVITALDSAASNSTTLTVLSLLPDWPDNTGVAAIITSRHLRSHWHLLPNRHKVCLENGTVVPMGKGQRLSLLSTDPTVHLSPGLWKELALDGAATVPEWAVVK